MDNLQIGNKIEIIDSTDTDLIEWCIENARDIDEIIEIDSESKLLWTKNIPYAISFNDVVKYSDDDYIYWGYDN